LIHRWYRLLPDQSDHIGTIGQLHHNQKLTVKWSKRLQEIDMDQRWLVTLPQHLLTVGARGPP
jgi:hypothetical protein